MYGSKYQHPRIHQGKPAHCFLDDGPMFPFQEAPDSDTAFVRMRKWLNDHPHYMVKTDTDCFQMLLSEDKVAVVGEVTALQSMQRKVCQNASVVVVNDNVYPSYLALAFPKGSHYTHKATEKCGAFSEP